MAGDVLLKWLFSLLVAHVCNARKPLLVKPRSPQLLPQVSPAVVKPSIGVLVQETRYGQPHSPNQLYITRSYRRFIEEAGGVVYPIVTNLTTPELNKVFNSINGILLPGGNTPLLSSPYYKTAKELFDLAVQANNNGDYFPIWGTCLGLQAFHVFLVGDESVIAATRAKDSSWPLNFTTNARTSKLFSGAPDHVIAALQNEAITYNNHKNCVKSIEYEKHDSLRNFYNILSTNKDHDGMEFVSTAEAINYPFYGVQWHPEKSLYVYKSKKISHSKSAIEASQFMANFFLSEARKNRHVMFQNNFNAHFIAKKKLRYSHCAIGEAGEEECYVI